MNIALDCYHEGFLRSPSIVHTILTQLMWYLVQRSPDGLRALSANESRERLEFMLQHRYKRFLPKCDYAIMHSGHMPLT